MSVTWLLIRPPASSGHSSNIHVPSRKLAASSKANSLVPQRLHGPHAGGAQGGVEAARHAGAAGDQQGLPEQLGVVERLDGAAPEARPADCPAMKATMLTSCINDHIPQLSSGIVVRRCLKVDCVE
jgi:hypothetical protein